MTLNANNIASLQFAITQDLDAIKEWTASNKLTVNPNKSQLLVIPSKRNFEPINIDVHYNNCSILPENVVKYLGIFIDSDLNFHNHIKYIASKASRAIGVISKIKYLIPFKTLLSIRILLTDPPFPPIWVISVGLIIQNLHRHTLQNSEKGNKNPIRGKPI